MKQITKITTIFLFLALLWGCQDTKLGDVDLDFDITLDNKEVKSYLGKPIKLAVTVNLDDNQNNYPFETKIRFKDGIMKVNGEIKNSDEAISFDYKTKGTLNLEFTPTKTGDQDININIKNQLVQRTAQCRITCSEALYSIELKDAPERPLIDTKFDFSLLLKEAESTGADSVVAYARVIKGSGFVYSGEQLINEGAKDSIGAKAAKTTLLTIGKNNISYHSTKEGENTIRFYVTNKWGHETYQDITTNINLPEWKLTDSEKGKIVDVPHQDNYSFTLNLEEKDIFKDNTYEGFYRILSNTDLTVKINDKAYTQGATIPLKAGGNVGILNVKGTGEGAIEFIVKDKYKQQNKDTLRFASKLPLKPIEASLDKSSQSVKINQVATFKLTLNEQNYSDIFTVKYQINSGTGTFEGGTTQNLSAGTHTLKYTPTAAGSHTFKITVTDKNSQTKELSATVQASLSPMTATLSSTTLNLIQGEKGSTTLTVSEADYTGRFYLKYTASGTAGRVDVGTVNLGVGGVAHFEGNTMNISVTPSVLGTATYSFVIEDDYHQTKELPVKVVTKGKVTATAGAGGDVSGGGNFDLNQSCTLKATPNTGYSFLGWYKNGNLVSNQATYTFNVTESINLEARFSTNSYTVSATAETGGSATGGGVVEHGKTATLKATVNTGYTFAGWYEGATKVSSALEYTITVTSNKTFVAKFTPNSYNITVNATTGGTVTGGGSYKHNETATLKATANTGYAFTGWYLGSTKVSDSPNYNITVTGAATYEAKFSANTYAITVNAQEGGAVSGAGNFNHGDNVIVKATPDANYDFVAWFEGSTQVSTSATYNFTITKARILEARFKLKQYTLSVSATTGGTVTGGGTYDYNTNVTLTAASQSGYAFSGWYEGGNKLSGNLSYIAKVTGNRSIEARFEANKFNVIVNGETGGTVSGSGAFSYNTNATVTATVNTNYTFGGWYDGSTQVSTSLSYTFKVTKETTLTAKFIVNKHTVTITGAGTQTGAGTYDWNTNATVKATAPANNEFVGWYEGSTQVSTSATYTFKVTKDIILEARYQLVKYTLSVVAETGGTVTGGATVEHGKTATVKATPNANYTFAGWYNGATKVSTDATYTVTVTSNMSLVAKFTANKFNVTVNAQAGGTVTGGGSFDYNSSVTVKATVLPNYTFAGWYNGSTKVSDATTYTFTLTGAVTLEARFTPTKFSVTVNALTGGTASGSGSFDYNSNVTVTAVVGTGYTFDGWYNGATKVSTALVYTFVLTGATTLEARFTPKEFTIIVNAATGGTVTGGGKVKYDANTTVTATPGTGYAFSGWYEGSTQVSTTASYTFKVEKDRTLEARFTANKYNIVVNAGTGGTASGSASVAYGTNATVTASPSTGYDFDGWYEGSTKVSSNASYTFTVTKALTLEARFIVKKFTVTLSGTNGSQTGAGSYNYNTNATLKATPSTGYQLTGWYEGSTQLSTSNPYVFAVTKDRIIEAKYQLIKYTVTPVTSTGGTVSGGGSIEHGKNATITATPSANYIFDGWYNGSTKVSSSASYTFAVTSNISLTAKFTLNTFNISVTAEDGGTVTGGGAKNAGTSVTLTATLGSYHTFDGWYEGTSRVSTSLNYTFTVTGARTLVAKFTPKIFIEVEATLKSATDYMYKEGSSNCTSFSATVYKDANVYVKTYTYKNGVKTAYNTTENITVKFSVSHEYAYSSSSPGYGISPCASQSTASTYTFSLNGVSTLQKGFVYNNESSKWNPRISRINNFSGLSVDKTQTPTGNIYVNPTRVSILKDGNQTSYMYFD